MRKTAFLALLVVGLAGCATTAPSTYGNFTQSAPAAFNQTMADDAAKQLVAVYPPASTRFDLQHATPAAFYAHVPSRNDLDEISEQFVESGDV